MKNFLRYQLPWQLAMLAIFIQSTIERIPLPDIGIDWFDKILHFLAYGVLAILVLRGTTHASNQWIRKNAWWIAAVLTSLFGASDEFHQYFVPGRSASIGDWIADTLGALAFIQFYLKWKLNQKTGKRASTGR